MDKLPVSGKLELTHIGGPENETTKTWRFPKQKPEFYRSLDDYIYQILIGFVGVTAKFIQSNEDQTEIWMANLLYRVSKAIYQMASDHEAEYKKGLTG